jgi:DNA-binding transcriptional MerR regulator
MSTNTKKIKQDSFKMKDLIEKTGISRETIHFYLTEGLLPEPKKTSKNMSWYSQEHVDRINTIKELQEKQFLPLKAIKVILNNVTDHNFTQEQEMLINEIKEKLFSQEKEATSLAINLKELSKQLKLSKKEIEELKEIGFISNKENNDFITKEEKELIEGWVKIRELGVSKENSICPQDFQLINNTISYLFEQELSLITKKLWNMKYEQAITLIDEAVPVVNSMFAVLHKKKIKEFITQFTKSEATK